MAPTACRSIADAYLPGTSETKSCTDCHVSVNNDNNAIMAQLLMQGTGYVNFMGRYCWVAAGEHGLWRRRRHRARRAAGRHRQHAARAGLPGLLRTSTSSNGWQLRARPRASRHATSARSCCIPSASRRSCRCSPAASTCTRPAARAGLRVFDIAFIDDKSFSERITTAPVSPLGQQFYVPDEVRRRRRRPVHARARPDAHAPPREPGAARSTRCTATSTWPTSTRA